MRARRWRRPGRRRGHARAGRQLDELVARPFGNGRAADAGAGDVRAAGRGAGRLRAIRVLAGELGTVPPRHPCRPSTSRCCARRGQQRQQPSAVAETAERRPARRSAALGGGDPRVGRRGWGRTGDATGPGGAGRRAAIDGGRRLNSDGVWLIELAPVADPADLAQAALSALGAREAGLISQREAPIASRSAAAMSPRERLTEALAGKQALLVLDNCEHLVAAVADLAADLLARCPRLRILATSRERWASPGSCPPASRPCRCPEPGADSSCAPGGRRPGPWTPRRPSPGRVADSPRAGRGSAGDRRPRPARMMHGWRTGRTTGSATRSRSAGAAPGCGRWSTGSWDCWRNRARALRRLSVRGRCDWRRRSAICGGIRQPGRR